MCKCTFSCFKQRSSNFICILKLLKQFIPGLILLSDVNRGLILSSDNPFDFNNVTLLVLATVLKYLQNR